MKKWNKLDKLYLCIAIIFIFSLGVILYQINNNEKKKVLIVQNPLTISSESISSESISSELISNDSLSNENASVKQSEVTPSIININTATSEELQTLKGIGPQKAQAIIDFRTNTGKFNHISEIVNVSGIGNKTFESIKEYITIGKD